MADDRDALIATLTEEGWTPDDTPAWWACVAKAGAWVSVAISGFAQVNTDTWGCSFTYDTPNSVILAAARAAVEAEQ